MKVGEKFIDLGRVQCSVLNVIAEHDTIALPAMSEPLPSLVSSKDSETRRYPVGHIGLSASSKGATVVWPSIASWIGERSKPMEP
ncbi:hypothetical protein ACLESO_20455 [Pyxidicoccus sp. 3LG]